MAYDAKAYSAKYYLEHKENDLENHKVYMAQYYLEHRDEMRARTKAWRLANRERYLAGSREYSKTNSVKNVERATKWNKEHPESRTATLTKWAIVHREENNAKSVEWARLNPEKVAATRVRYWKKHPWLRSIYKQVRRSRQANATGADYLTPELLAEKWSYWGGLCYLCGLPASATDHVVPIKHGGSLFPANLRPICHHCNSVKGAKWPYDFAAHRARERTQLSHYCQVLDLVME